MLPLVSISLIVLLTTLAVAAATSLLPASEVAFYSIWYQKDHHLHHQMVLSYQISILFISTYHLLHFFSVGLTVDPPVALMISHQISFACTPSGGKLGFSVGTIMGHFFWNLHHRKLACLHSRGRRICAFPESTANQSLKDSPQEDLVSFSNHWAGMHNLCFFWEAWFAAIVINHDCEFCCAVTEWMINWHQWWGYNIDVATWTQFWQHFMRHQWMDFHAKAL